MIPLSHYLILGAILFCLGVFGALTRRNAIAILMSIELMLNAVSLNFIAFARYLPQTMLQGQVFAIFIITIAAAEAAVPEAVPHKPRGTEPIWPSWASRSKPRALTGRISNLLTEPATRLPRCPMS